MKIFSSRKRVAAIGVVTAATLVGGGMAFAYWTTTGTGTGEASTAEGLAGNLSFEQDPDPLLEMYPGDENQLFDVTVTNTDTLQNSFVKSVTAYVTTSADADCDGSNFLLNGEEADVPVKLKWNADGVDLEPLVPEVSLENTIQFNNTDENQDKCKDVTVTINYAAAQ
jgi:hypothetical protein